MTMLSIRLLVVAASFAAISTANAAPSTKTGTTSKGPTLTDQRGMSLYTFDKDKDGKSACNGPCAANWPASRIIHHLAFSRSGRRAYGMYEPRDVRDPAPIWSSRDAAVDGNNANSVSGSNSAVENEGSSG